MAVKFSQFVVETDKANVNYLVGWDGVENVQITPADLLSGTPSGSGAAGQVAFFDSASTLAGDNDLYWDNTNKRLGISTSSPQEKLDISSGSIRLDDNQKITWSTNDSNIGRVRITGNESNDFITFVTDNSERMRIAGNNVGIGTTSPSAKLDVDGSLIATGISQLGSGGSNVYLTSSSAGNVGIGTSSPNNKLVVNGTVHLGSNGSDVTIGASNSSVIFMLRSGYNYIQASDASGALMFRTGGNNNRMIIDSSGNVGIGTASPTTKLHIDESGTTSPALFIDTARYGASIIGDGTSNSQYLLNLQSNGGSTEVMRVQSSGNVGIGTTSPSEKLEVIGIIKAVHTDSTYAKLRGNGVFFNRSDVYISPEADNSQTVNIGHNGSRWGNVEINAAVVKFENGSNEFMRINSSGNVGIGTTSPAAKLDVVGRIGLNDGNSNVLVGSNAGDALTTGSFNVALGSYALTKEDTGNKSIAIGYAALENQNNSNDNYNVAIGHNAGKQITTGTLNTLIGGLAGDALTTGFSNIAIGYQASGAATIANNNVAIGIDALHDNVAGDRNVAIGSEALEKMTQASTVDTYNVAIGYNAGKQVTTGVQNTIIGGLAGDALTTGSGNTALGYGTLSVEQAGGRNVAIGWKALVNQNTGVDSYNVAVGYEAGELITTGIQNTLIGGLAGDSLNTGNNNIAIGYLALTTETSGGNNVAIGVTALQQSNGGTYNVAIGRDAGQQITTGSTNTLIGAEAGDAITTGANNVVIGYDAADVLLDGVQNTLVGDQVAGALTSGDENTYIGRRAASSATTGNQNVAIGAGVSLSSATVSNEVNISNSSVIARFQGAASSWSFVSDARDKKDIEDLELGVEFINKLKPRKFKWDLRDSDVDKDKEASGFVAQEIKEVLDKTGVDYTGIVDTNNPDQYTVAQANIIPILVKAVQELSAEVKELKSKI